MMIGTSKGSLWACTGPHNLFYGDEMKIQLVYNLRLEKVILSRLIFPSVKAMLIILGLGMMGEVFFDTAYN